MVSEKAIVVILVIAIVLSAISIILTASISVSRPTQLKIPGQETDTAGGKIYLQIIPQSSPPLGVS